jgi:MFS family permease
MEKLLCEYSKPTSRHYKILSLCWAGWVFDFYDLILFTFLISMIKTEMGFNNFQLSYTLGISLAATALGGVIFGLLSDKYGRKTVLQWTILAYSIGTVLSGLAFNIESLIIFRIITGLGVGGEWATGQTFVSESIPGKIRGRFGAFMQTGAPVGVALASVVGGFAAPEIGWRLTFILSGIPAILVILIRKHLAESDVWLQKQKDIKNGIINNRIGTDIKNKIAILFSDKYRKLFIFSIILAVFDMSSYWFTFSWMPEYLHTERNFSMTKSALFMIVTQTGAFLGYATFGFAADKIGRRPSYSIYAVIMSLGLLMITVLWDVIAAHQFVIFVFMFMVGFGAGMFGGYGPLFSELFSTEIRGTAMGTAFNLARGVQFFTPIIISYVAINYGFGGGISIAIIFTMLTGIWIWVFPETKGINIITLKSE